jgi:proteasome lid subunit RPN8/RPN11
MIEAIEQLVLSRRAWECVVGHAESAAPDEAVGMLGGDADGRVACVAPLPNLARRGAFLADPRAQFEAERAFSRNELIPLAAYHSHPGGTATLSPADKVFAHPKLLQLVVALGPGGQVEMRAYRVAHGVCRISVRIEGSSRPRVVDPGTAARSVRNERLGTEASAEALFGS